MPLLKMNRVRHSVSVAEFMYSRAASYGLPKDEMYVLGLLHDIGYISDAKEHPVVGAELLSRVGLKYAKVISWHGTAQLDYLKLTQLEEPPAELVLLWQADMSIDVSGRCVSYDERLADIAQRHGYDSVDYRISSETVDWLKSNNIV